jgi:hypothetical protein
MCSEQAMRQKTTVILTIQSTKNNTGGFRHACEPTKLTTETKETVAR